MGSVGKLKKFYKRSRSFDRLPGAGIPLIQLNMRVGSTKTVKKGDLKRLGALSLVVFLEKLSAEFHRADCCTHRLVESQL